MPASAVARGRAARLADTLIKPHPIGIVEAGVATVALLALAFTVFGPHIVNGGFIMDDWSNQAKSRYLASCCGPGVTGSDPSFRGEVRNMLNDGPAGYHLGLTVIAPVVHYFFGMSMGLHLALAAGLGAIMSACFYVVVRLVGLERLPAAAVAGLVLLFPFSDSTRLWAMASFNQIAVILWLLGVLLAFAGLRQASLPRAVALHAGALGLYLLGILTYEQVAGAVLVTVIFYRLWGASWPGAGIRWAADATVTALSLYIAVTEALPRVILSWDDRFEHAGLILRDALALLPSVVAPLASPSRLLVAAVMAAIVGRCIVRVRALPAGDAQRAAMRRWLLLTGAGVLGIAVGYALTVPSFYGSPLDVGIENRVNMLAAFGWILFVYAVAMLGGLLAAGRLGRPLAWAPVVPLVLCVFIAAGYLGLLADSSEEYDRSYAEQVRVLDGVGKSGPYREGSTIYTFGHPTYIAPGVPVYTWIWDQNPAVKVWLKDASLASFPILPGTEFRCLTNSLGLGNSFGFGPGQGARYRNAYFVDTETGAATRIDDRQSCLRAVEQFKPGPLARGRPDCGLFGGGAATRLIWSCGGRLVGDI